MKYPHRPPQATLVLDHHPWPDRVATDFHAFKAASVVGPRTPHERGRKLAVRRWHGNRPAEAEMLPGDAGLATARFVPPE
ncbi:hypothetical protein DF3PA_340011 [Candidatus Defluviicoccus seviourii]|uniref:Uncharacterized protein n=1 Tax=Candidatus Defluviicoccus seviourii TaxID=2565273 RepID=A0A564WF01_9PROT|nr:hypothetical protein DF3PA_340011 [Candidatus Defluviicoccus seviourii]